MREKMLINEKLGFKSWPSDILATMHRSLWEQKRGPALEEEGEKLRGYISTKS